MKDKDLFVFIVFELLLIAISIWGFINHYPLLEYGPMGFLLVNTLAIVLKLTGSRKDRDGGGNDK